MLCRVHHDGHHYIASAPGRRPYAGVKRRPKTPQELAFRALYRGTKAGYYQDTAEGREYMDGMTDRQQRTYIADTLHDTFGDVENWREFVDKNMDREQHNYFVRKKRFERKAFWNHWNYFVTFTYDGELLGEDAFKRKLRRALSNLHTRRGWLYMGVWERAPKTGRLHFHGVAHVPDGQMVGTIRDEESYDKKSGRMKMSHINDWFEKRYGRNDFCPITDDDLRRGTSLGYILKYVEKTGERIVYSRGIPSDEVAEICTDQCACEFFKFVKKWVLFDDWRSIKPGPNTIVEGPEAEEWLICFTGYEYEGYSYMSEPDYRPPDKPFYPASFLKQKT